MRSCLIPLGLLLAWASLTWAEDPGQVKSDEALLRSAEVQTDGPGLLDYLRRQTLRESDRARVEALLKLLGDEDFEKREQATADLIRIGAIAVGPLKQATRHTDIEVVRRAERCLEAIGQRANPTCLAAAIRLLGVRRPEGSVEVLLNFLPSSGDPNEIDEVSQALSQVAVREGAVNPLLLQALNAPDVVKRAVAGEVLARAGLAVKIPELRKLLADRDSTVRYRVGLALLEARDRDAVPVLIDLFRESSPEQTGIIEETLHYLAGARAPSDVPSEHTEAARKARVTAWLAWWKDHGAEVKLDRVDWQNRQLGYSLLVLYGIPNGIVREIDRNGKQRWQIENLNYPLDAQVLPGDRVLVCEYRSRAVTERDLKGRILWQYNTANSYPLNARRLPGGNTFIATRSGLVEVDRTGKEVWEYPHTNVAAGARLRDGSSILVTCLGQVLRVSREGKVLKDFSAGGPLMTIGTAVDVTPDGRILIPLYSQNKVVEFDANGKRTWEADTRLPGSVFRVPGGNVLVTSRLNGALQELDRTGKAVWSQQVEGRLMRASRR